MRPISEEVLSGNEDSGRRETSNASFGEENTGPDMRRPGKEEGIDLFSVAAEGRDGKNGDYSGPDLPQMGFPDVLTYNSSVPVPLPPLLFLFLPFIIIEKKNAN